MIVCVCSAVNEKTLREHAESGLSYEEIQIELGVAMQCGKCGDCAKDIVQNCKGKACYEACVSHATPSHTRADYFPITPILPAAA